MASSLGVTSSTWWTVKVRPRNPRKYPIIPEIPEISTLGIPKLGPNEIGTSEIWKTSLDRQNNPKLRPQGPKNSQN